MDAKTVDELTAGDFERHPIWEFVYDEVKYDDETWVQPVLELPAKHLDHRAVGIQVRLNCGIRKWARLYNIDLTDHLRTTYFRGISLEHAGKWLHLARYFDVTYHQDGPEALASALGMQLDEVFPIAYDISGLAIGPENILIDSIPAVLEMQLSREELRALSKRD